MAGFQRVRRRHSIWRAALVAMAKMTNSTAPLLAAGVGLALLTAAPARAENPEGDPDFISFGVGYFDAHRQRDEAIEGRLEYHSNKEFWYLKPFGGVMVNSDKAFNIFAGVQMDIYIGDRIVLTPSFAPGYYNKGDGWDLGFPIEFRSQFEVAFRFDDATRLGLSINHLSNASLDDRNPGVESVALTVAVPLRNFPKLW